MGQYHIAHGLNRGLYETRAFVELPLALASG